MTNEDINDCLRLAIMEEVNKRLGKNFECVNDLIDYTKNLKKENEQLKQQIKTLKEGKQYETCPYRSTDMGCDYCDYRDRNLKEEWKEK